MSPDAQRIAIAEACEWDVGLFDVCHCGDPIKTHSSEHSPVPMLAPKDLPDFLENLNAMNGAEKTLSDEQTHTFAAHLYDTINRHGERIPVWHASAAQRAEAFLRTLNLWTDQKGTM